MLNNSELNFTVTSSRINTGNCEFNALVRQKFGKAKVCKTFIHQFKSGRHLHKTVIKKMSQSFFVVASKIGDFDSRFLNTVLQCCPTVFGRFAHFFCRFLEFGRGVGSFF